MIITVIITWSWKLPQWSWDHVCFVNLADSLALWKCPIINSSKAFSLVVIRWYKRSLKQKVNVNGRCYTYLYPWPKCSFGNNGVNPYSSRYLKLRLLSTCSSGWVISACHLGHPILWQIDNQVQEGLRWRAEGICMTLGCRVTPQIYPAMCQPTKVKGPQPTTATLLIN